MDEQPIQNVPVQVPTPPTPPDKEEELRRVIGVPATVSTVGYSRKLNGADLSGLKTSQNMGWLISATSKTDPFYGVPRNANQTTDPVLSYPVDYAFTGEGVDIVTVDGGDSFAYYDHPEWLSTKYGTTRYVQEDWTSHGNFPVVSGTAYGASNAANAAYGFFLLPLSVSSQFLGLPTDSTTPWEFYGRKLTINSGPGAGQSRRISQGPYLLAGSYYYAVVDTPWDVITTGTAQAGSTTTVTLAAGSSATNDFYVNYTISIESGTGSGQSALITAYNGTTKVATISGTWTAPASGSTYTIANVPTSSSTYTIAAFTQPANYYSAYITGTHGTGTMALAAGKNYGFSKESTLRSLGSHGGTRLVGGNNGAFSFSGSTIISTNSTVRTRLSYLAAGDFITIAGATSSSNNGAFVVSSNTDNGTTRTLTITNKTFVSEAAVSGTTITHDRCLWGYTQALYLVKQFHLTKADKTRPTVLISNLVTTVYYTNIAQISTAYINGAYVAVDLTTAAGRTAASDNYFLPFRDTSNRSLVGAGGSLAYLFNQLTDAGVIVVTPAGNEDYRIVDSDHAAYNDYTCIPGDTVTTTGTAQAGATSTITLAAGASSTAGAYVGLYIKLTSGTGSGQNRVITAYDGTTKIATVATPWTVTPNNTSAYSIVNLVQAYHNRGMQSTTPEVIAAGAVGSLYYNNQEYRASYSIVGPRVDVYAPADGTMTATFDVTARPLWNGTSTNSTSNVAYPDNASYLTGGFSGTSAACPVTGGVVGCMAQARPWMDSGAARAAIQDVGTKDRLYIPSPDVFSDQKSLGGGINNYLYYPYTHVSDA